MKILIIADVTASHLTGGAPRVLRAQAEGLAGRNHDVIVMVKGVPDDFTPEPSDLPGGAVELQVPWKGGRGPFGFLQLRSSGRKILADLLANWRPELVIIQQPLLAGGLMRTTDLRNIPSLYVCHSFAFEEYFTRERRDRLLRSLGARWLKREEKLLLNHSDRVVVLSEYTRQKLSDTYSINSGVVIIPGGVDSSFHPAGDQERERLRNGFGMKGEAFLTVRNLVPRTGVDLLIDAFHLLNQSNPATQLWIAGTGPLKSAINERISDLGLADSVRMLGFVPDETLPDLYRAADCFVLPTLYLEGFGLVTIEALACGTPVVATPVGANPDVVGSWRGDAVVDSLDPESLSSGMDHMLKLIRSDTDGLRKSCADYGSHFTWDNHVNLLERELLSLRDLHDELPGEG
jgi:glycosyltransferase involved in cell wall biosynthesis